RTSTPAGVVTVSIATRGRTGCTLHPRAEPRADRTITRTVAPRNRKTGSGSLFPILSMSPRMPPARTVLTLSAMQPSQRGASAQVPPCGRRASRGGRRYRRPKGRGDRVENRLRLGHAAGADGPAGLPPLVGADHPEPIVNQRP